MLYIVYTIIHYITFRNIYFTYIANPKNAILLSHLFASFAQRSPLILPKIRAESDWSATRLLLSLVCSNLLPTVATYHFVLGIDISHF